MAILLAAGSVAAAERSEQYWPHWRGPSIKGTAPTASPPLKWSETEHVKWKVKTPGFGTSTPIVWQNHVFILTAIPTGKKIEPPTTGTAETPAPPTTPPAPAAAPAADPAPAPAPAAESRTGGDQQGRRRRPGGGSMRSEKPTEAYQFAVLSVDRASGKILWQKTAREQVPHEGHHRDHGFASGSPITDGEHLYVSFGSRGLYCYDLKGNLKWEKDLGDMQTRNAFGEGSSPALQGNTLVMNWDHEGEDFIVALDKRTGQELWRQPRDEPTTWSTPLIVEHDGKPQVVVSARNRIRSYDLASGEKVWECGGMTENVIPTPVSDFGLVYAISGFRGAALLAIKLGKSGDLTDSDAIAWRHSKATPYVPL
ncbi:MAG: PQQ-binding-like beta-propeller repeat protein [Verrucomicrobiales bacterium]